MATINKHDRMCCTCKYFGGKAELKGSMVEYENVPHTCKIGARGCGNINPAMTSGCSKWKEIDR